MDGTLGTSPGLRRVNMHFTSLAMVHMLSVYLWKQQCFVTREYGEKSVENLSILVLHVHGIVSRAINLFTLPCCVDSSTARSDSGRQNV